jgi:hypothetical protein
MAMPEDGGQVGVFGFAGNQTVGETDLTGVNYNYGAGEGYWVGYYANYTAFPSKDFFVKDVSYLLFIYLQIFKIF